MGLIRNLNIMENDKTFDKYNESYLISSSLINSLINDFDIKNKDDLNRKTDKESFYFGKSLKKIKINIEELTNYTIKYDNTFELIAIKNYLQFKGDLCGFHTLFNTSCLLNYFFENDSFYLEKMNSGVEFYKYHSKIMNYVKYYNDKFEYDNEDDRIQEYIIEDVLNFGPLDQSLIPLLTNDLDFKELANKLKYELVTLFFSHDNIVTQDINEIKEIQKKINHFISDNEVKFLVIILGITNHWTGMVIMKQKDNSYKCYFLESLNEQPYLSYLKDKESIKNYVEIFNKDKNSKGVKNMSEFDKDMFCCWFSDVKKAHNLIYKLFNKSGFSLIEYFVEKNWNCFCNYLLNAKIENVKDLIILLNDKIHPLVVRNDTLEIMITENMSFESLKIFNFELFENIVKCVNLSIYYRENFSNSLVEKGDDRWMLNVFYNFMKDTSCLINKL